ncbi:MAG: hypothetical protein HXY19_01805 [Thermoanaerobaculaceae bacterium]|jgi:hypothetical protein|nr:hypothetical protein [Thermoanaerobaculaceae bacterium]
MRFGFRGAVLFVLLAVVASQEVVAAELDKGAKELNLSLLLQDTSDAGFYFNGTGRVGYLVTTAHEVGTLFSLLYVRPDGQGTIKAGSIGAFYRYNFATTHATVLPFLGVAAYTYFGDLRDSVDWGWQTESGLRVLVTQRASINTTVFWKREYISSPWVTGDRVFGATVGFSLFF